MKKLLLLICVLLGLGTSGAWADITEITVCDNTNQPTTYGSFSNQVGSHYGTFTTNAASGLAGVTIKSADNTLNQVNYPDSYKNCFQINGGTGSYDIEIEAPSGYIIADYTLQTMKTSTNQNSTSATVTAADGTATTSFNTGGATLYAMGVNSKTTKFTVSITTGKTSIEVCIAKMYITLIPDYEKEVVICDNMADPSSKFGTLSNKGTDYYGTFTTNAASGLAGLTVSSTDKLIKYSYYDSYKHCFALRGAPDTYTINIEAPSGYQIVEYSLINMKTTTSSNSTGVIVSAGGNSTINFSTAEQTFRVSNIHANSTSFTAAMSSSDTFVELCIPRFRVIVASNIDYKLYYNNTLEGSETVERNTGEAVSIPSSLDNGFMTYQYYSSYSEGVFSGELSNVPASGDVYVKATWNGPFDLSDDFASAKWYYVSMRGKWIIYNSSTVSGIDDHELGDAGQWAFLGNPYDGIQVINKNAGDDTYLTYSGKALSFNTTATDWSIAIHPSTYVDGFWIYDYVSSKYHIPYTGSDGAVTAIENTDGLTAGNDGGSSQGGGAWVVSAVPSDFSDLVASNIRPYIENAADDVCFKISTSVASALTSAINTANDGGAGSISSEEYLDLLSELKENIKYPTTGFYRMVNHEGGYAGATSTTASLVAGGDNAASTVLYLTKSLSANTYTIQVQGKYLSAPSQGYDVTLTSTPVIFTPAVAAPGYASFKADGTGLYGYIGLDNSNNLEGAAATGIGSNPKAYWALESATSATIPLTAANDNTGTAHTYATLCVPFNITGLTGADSKEVKAYVPTKSGSYIVPGDGATTVTEGTPVLLIGAEGATSVTATIGSNHAATPATTNVLTGTFAGTSFDCTSGSSNYVLGFDSENDNRIGFYHVSGGSSFALKANRAYLNTSAGVKGFAISFGDIIDSIKAMDNTPVVHDGPIFNLAGQRINRLQRGVNIVKGKKVIVK